MLHATCPCVFVSLWFAVLFWVARQNALAATCYLAVYIAQFGHLAGKKTLLYSMRYYELISRRFTASPCPSRSNLPPICTNLSESIK